MILKPIKRHWKLTSPQREKEIRRFKEFRQSVDKKEGKNGNSDNDQGDDKGKSTDPDQNEQEEDTTTDSENPYERISDEVNQLESIKDVLDELNILKNLAQKQKLVDDLWNGITNEDSRKQALPLSKILSDIEGMIRDAKSVQSDFNTLLDLKQKEAGIVEAQAARRQSDTVMAFTVVTIIFVSRFEWA